MRVTSNMLRLAVLIILAFVTTAIIILGKAESAQDAFSHMLAVCIGTILHSISRGDEKKDGT